MPSAFRRTGVGFLSVALLLMAGCASDDQRSTTVTTAKPEVTVPEGQPPSELRITDLSTGEGAEAKAGDLVTVHYVGKSWSTKEQFDASWDRGQPFTFTLGAGNVIAGWDQGVQGMKEGGRRELVIPPHLGYGAAGAGGGVIAPNETLVFVVDLISVA